MFLKRLLIAIALLSSISAFAQVSLPPPVTTLNEQIRYLLFLQDQVPALFEQGAEYDVDFLAYIEAQNTLVEALTEDSAYMRAASARPPLQELQVFHEEEVQAGIQVHLNHSNLIAALAGYDALDLRKNKDKDELKGLMKTLEGANLKGLLTGLMSLYSGSKKNDGFKIKTNKEKIDFLKANPLPEEVLKMKFKAEKFGLNSGSIEWSQILGIAESWQIAEMMVVKTLYDLFENKSDAGQRIENKISELDASLDGGKITENLLTSLEQQFNERVTSPGQKELVKALRLTEVPPAIGMFRGLAGGDCSTSLSFPFAYSPQERTYFMYTANNELLGYLQGTVVGGGSGNKKYLYVHTVSGPNISPRHVQMALHALHASASKLDVADILLPTSEKIVANVNYVAVQKALNAVLDAKHSIEPKYLDEKFREKVTAINYGRNVRLDDSFDMPESNGLAHHVLWDSKLSKEISVKSIEIAPPPMRAKTNLSKGEAILIALDLLTGERLTTASANLARVVAEIKASGLTVNPISYDFRSKVANEILQKFNMDQSRLTLNEALANSERKPLAEYYAGLKAEFAKFDIVLDDNVIRHRPYLFYEGHLMARDAFDSKNKELFRRSVDYVITLIKRWPDPALAYSMIKNHLEDFAQSERFQKFVLSLFTGAPEDYAKLQRIHQVGYRFNKFPRADVEGAANHKLSARAVAASDKKVIQQVLEWVRREAKSGGCEQLLELAH